MEYKLHKYTALFCIIYTYLCIYMHILSKSGSSGEIHEQLTLSTFQLFVHATEITNLGHNNIPFGVYVCMQGVSAPP